MTKIKGQPYKHHDLPPRDHPDYGRLYREKHKTKLKIKAKERLERKVEKNPNYWKETYNPKLAAEYRKNNPKYFREYRWKQQGILNFTYEKYLLEIEKQNNLCSICKNEMKKPHVDHDHETGQYRGLLCSPCNTGLGIYEKMKNKFEEYLE